VVEHAVVIEFTRNANFLFLTIGFDALLCSDTTSWLIFPMLPMAQPASLGELERELPTQSCDLFQAV
jgi:hypothetical protein